MASKKEELLAAIAAHKAVENLKREVSAEVSKLSNRYWRAVEAANPNPDIVLQSTGKPPAPVPMPEGLEEEYTAACKGQAEQQELIQIELEAAWEKLQAAKAAYKAELLTPQVPPTPKPDRSRVKRLIQDFDDRIKGVDLTAEEFRALMVILLQRFHP